MAHAYLLNWLDSVAMIDWTNSIIIVVSRSTERLHLSERPSKHTSKANYAHAAFAHWKSRNFPYLKYSAWVPGSDKSALILLFVIVFSSHVFSLYLAFNKTIYPFVRVWVSSLPSYKHTLQAQLHSLHDPDIENFSSAFSDRSSVPDHIFLHPLDTIGARFGSSIITWIKGHALCPTMQWSSSKFLTRR